MSVDGRVRSPRRGASFVSLLPDVPGIRCPWDLAAKVVSDDAGCRGVAESAMVSFVRRDLCALRRQQGDMLPDLLPAKVDERLRNPAKIGHNLTKLTEELANHLTAVGAPTPRRAAGWLLGAPGDGQGRAPVGSSARPWGEGQGFGSRMPMMMWWKWLASSVCQAPGRPPGVATRVTWSPSGRLPSMSSR